MSEEKKTSLWEKTVSLLPKKDPAKGERSSKKKSTLLKVSPSATPTEAMAEDKQTKDQLQLKEVSVMLKKSAQKFKKNVETVITASTKKNKNKGREKDKRKDTEEADHVWDENLAHMEIAKKRQSVFQREIVAVAGTRHVTMLAPMPEYYSVAVRKMKQKVEKIHSYPVLKPADPCAQFEQILCYGPRLNSQGQIVAHSILGETSDFLREAARRNQFKEITESQAVLSGADVLQTYKPSPRGPENPLLKENLALQSWDREMKERKLEMKRLADRFSGDETHHVRGAIVADQFSEEVLRTCIKAWMSLNLGQIPPLTMELAALERLKNRRHHFFSVAIDPILFKLAGLIGRPEKQLLMSKADDFVTKSKGRQLLTAALDYDHDKHLGVCFWKLQHAEGHKQIRTTLTKQERGIIPTPEMSGDAASIRLQKGSLREPLESSWFSSDYLRDRDEQMGGVIKIYNKMLFDDLEVCGKSITKPQKSTDSTSAVDNIGLCSPGGDAASHLSDVNKEIVLEEENCFTGPCLKIEDTVLKWVKGHHQGDRVVKATYILIEGLVGDMTSNFIYLQNCGTTSIRYHWSKCLEVKPIPISRPRRPAAFYLNDEEGVILPGDTEKIEVKFRSQVPGCFSESWSLGTVPILAAGGQIKFILKGWARAKINYSQECRWIQETLEKREAATLCSYLTKEIIAITLQAYLQSIRLREELDCPTEDILFVQENPGLFFHAHVVKKLKILYNSLSIEVTGSPTPIKDSVLSVTQLTKIIHSLPDADNGEEEEEDDDDDDDDDDDVEVCSDRKEVLLWKLYCDISTLSFTPFSPWMSLGHLRYIICYGLLRDGIRQVTDLAEFLANCLDLVVKQSTEADLEEAKPKEKGRGKGHINSGKPKMKKAEEPKDTEVKGTTPTENKPQAFSPVYQYRVKNPGENAVLNLYDEKVYILMYSMLDGIVHKMMELFETP